MKPHLARTHHDTNSTPQWIGVIAFWFLSLSGTLFAGKDPVRETIAATPKVLRTLSPLMTPQSCAHSQQENKNSEASHLFQDHQSFVKAFSSLKNFGPLRLSGTVTYTYPCTDSAESAESLHHASIASYEEPASGYLSRNFTLEVLEAENEVVGSIEIKEWVRDNRKEFYIVSVEIKPRFQAKGFGSKAMKGLTTFFNQSSLSFDQLGLKVASQVPYAALLYTRAGFTLPVDTVNKLATLLQLSPAELTTTYLSNSAAQVHMNQDGISYLFGKPLERNQVVPASVLRSALRDMTLIKGSKHPQQSKDEPSVTSSTF